MKKNKMKALKAENPVEATSSQPSLSENRTAESLKPESKIAKNTAAKKRTRRGKKKLKGTPQAEGNNELTVTGTLPTNSNEIKDGKKLDLKGENMSMDPTNEKRDENTSKNVSNEKKDEKALKNVAKKKHASSSHENKRKKQKPSRLEEQHNQKDRGKYDTLEMVPRNQISKRENRTNLNQKDREKLGGLIFMCNAKTKPDCFHYCVMGVPTSRKDLMLDIKPGLKLFLYDYDLKLMYGIYKASSGGAIKLEPSAFGGAFPYQVRFTVHEDCYPLPESDFKKAIIENYNERHKFDTKLTIRQVKKLTRLFRPAEKRRSPPLIRSSPPSRVIISNTEPYEGSRETLPRSYMHDPYPRLSHERDQHIVYREAEMSVGRDKFPREQFLTENEYRTHGLGYRSLIAPSEGERVVRHHQGPIYREVQPVYNESHLDYRVSAPAAPESVSILPYNHDPYISRDYVAPADLYQSLARREEIASGSYSLGGREGYPSLSNGLLQRRIESDEVERYLTLNTDGLCDNQRDYRQLVRPESASVPVSSRYSFAGPSLYR